MNNLTNDAKFLLTSMYAEYLTRRKDEISKEQARNFQNINYLKNNIMSEWSEEDILDTCYELDKYGYIIGTKADNTFYLVKKKLSVFVSYLEFCIYRLKAFGYTFKKFFQHVFFSFQTKILNFKFLSFFYLEK